MTRNFVAIAFFLFALSPQTLSQTKTIKMKLTQSSFGTYLFCPNKNLEGLPMNYLDSSAMMIGVLFKDSNFVLSHRKKELDVFSLLADRSLRGIYIDQSSLKKFMLMSFAFTQGNECKTILYVNKSSISGGLRLEDLHFTHWIRIWQCQIEGGDIMISNCVFDDLFDMQQTKIIGRTIPTGLTLSIPIYVQKCVFNEECLFSFSDISPTLQILNTKFRKRLDLSDSNIRNGLICSNAEFFDDLNISFSQINGQTILQGCKFNGSLDLSGTVFNGKVDLRGCDLSSLKKLYLLGANYPIGQLWAPWDQLLGRDSLTIGYQVSEGPKRDELKLESIYTRLRDNAIAQGNWQLSNKIMYEYEIQKQRLFGGFWHKIYGLIFDFGYTPLKFGIIVLTLIMLFTLLWRLFFLDQIVRLLIPASMTERQGAKRPPSVWHSRIHSHFSTRT